MATRAPYPLDLVGLSFGSWRVAERLVSATGKSRWRCVCECGFEKEIPRQELVRNKTRMCRGCWTRRGIRPRPRTPRPKMRPGSRPLTEPRMWERVLDNYRDYAAHRGHVWGISDIAAIELMRAPCAYCGTPPRTPLNRFGLRNGIDRVDNSQGYLPENTITACADCNLGKGRKTREEFLEWALRVAEFQNQAS